jgi:hypothetical protein
MQLNAFNAAPVQYIQTMQLQCNIFMRCRSGAIYSCSAAPMQYIHAMQLQCNKSMRCSFNAINPCDAAPVLYIHAMQVWCNIFVHAINSATTYSCGFSCGEVFQCDCSSGATHFCDADQGNGCMQYSSGAVGYKQCSSIDACDAAPVQCNDTTQLQCSIFMRC